MLLFHYATHNRQHFHDRNRQNELLFHHKSFMIVWKKKEKRTEAI